ncbi:MAG TPA: anaerobic glycerol-3-phosphate dehydrogenase subunit C [Blastocatellia bacterium]|nr:anaerobic glycerol-3-phosphate dehydrogenase subunit C [Blastocatellia bacterium]HMZ19858.1 anaerobic glycerol-3-phosphate dehydrogenase subunit C [Blastocatellia bacterium]
MRTGNLSTIMLEQGDLTSAPVEWKKPDYWDAQDLDKELRRQYDVCNSCRLCFNLCPGFPKLFEHFDAVDHEPDKLTGEQVGEFVDLCYNCKLCFIKCPYTPPHKFLIDIPKVVMRARAQEEKKNGLDLREKMLSSPDEIGPLASMVAPLANAANKNKLNRILLEKFAGVHRDKILPTFHAQTFERWFKKKYGISTASGSERTELKVALFHTCIVNYNQPNIGKAAVAVLQKNGCEVADPAGQNCCGMPYLDSGRLETAIEHFRNNMKVLLPYVRQGYDIVIPEPSCGLLMKKEYYDYFRDEEREQAVELSKHVFDLSEYLVKLKNEGRLDRDFPVKVGKVAYHQPCHLKYQAIGNKSLELLRLAGAQVAFIDRGCSGHDGTWAMKKEYFDLAQKVAGKLHRAVNESQADIVATDCSLAGLQIQQGTGRETIHPVEVLAKAYGIEVE